MVFFWTCSYICLFMFQLKKSYFHINKQAIFRLPNKDSRNNHNPYLLTYFHSQIHKCWLQNTVFGPEKYAQFFNLNSMVKKAIYITIERMFYL